MKISLTNNVVNIIVITETILKVKPLVGQRILRENHSVANAYPKGTTKNKIAPHQKKEQARQNCGSDIMNESLKSAAQSDTIEKTKNAIAGRIETSFDFLLTELTTIEKKAHPPIIGLKKKKTTIPSKARIILNLLVLGSIQIAKNNRISPLIIPCKEGVAK